MMIDPYCQQQCCNPLNVSDGVLSCNPLNVLFNIMFLALIFHRFLSYAFIHALLSCACLSISPFA